MKLEDQVCSLDNAKKLNDLGAKQESFLYWTERWMPHQKDGYLLDYNRHGNQLSAFTVAELGEMLPKLENLVIMLFENGHSQMCVQDDVHIIVEADTEANARAKMLIYLLENNLISTRMAES